MKKLCLIPLILCLFLVGSSCKKSQEEPMTKMEKKVEKKIEKKSIDESKALKGLPPRMRRWGFIQRFDKNNDGKVSKEEFTGPDEVFNNYDKNQDGYIDKSEASKGLPPRMRKGG